MGFLFALLALGVVIFVHELGHLLAAKFSGIKVYEFSIGMGPKLISKPFGETDYSLRLLPVGGFVKLAGLDEEDGPVDPEDDFYTKPLWAKYLTISAGSLVNIVSGFCIFLFLFMVVGVPKTGSKIEAVVPNLPAQSAGLQAQDEIKTVNGALVVDAQSDIVQAIHQSGGNPVSLTINRDGQDRSLTLTPQPSPDNPEIYVIGIQLETMMVRIGFVDAIQQSLYETRDKVKLVFTSLGMLFTRQVGFSDMAGPVGIIQFAEFQFGRGMLHFLSLMAMISISLGVINLFPFPVLDGGHLLMISISAAMRKPLNKQWETAIHNVGAAILITLMVVIIANDIINWGNRGDLLKSLTP